MFHWPQITMIVLFAITGTVSLVQHGQPRTPHSFPVMLFSIVIEVWILVAGGFFG